MNVSTTITVNPLAIRAVMPCAGAKDVRFYLCTVALFKGKAGGVLAAATDGVTMAFCFDPAGTWEGSQESPVLIRRTNDGNSAATWKNSILADVAAIKPGRKDTPKACTITTDGAAGTCYLNGVNRNQSTAIENARYPDLTPYAARRYSGEIAAFDPEHLARVMEGPQFAGNHAGAHAVLLHNGEGAGTVVGLYDTPATGLEFAAVIMPLRLPRDRKPHPALAKPEGAHYADRPVPGLEWLARAFGVAP
jgi:hypothetical protein